MNELVYYILAMLALMTVSNAGNLLMATADTLGEAYIAKKIYYIGGCFIPPLILMVIFKLCNIYILKWVENIIMLYSFVVYGMVLTIGHNNMYYKSARIIKDGDATALIPEYGFGHSFFYMMLYGYLLLGVIVLFYSLKNKNIMVLKNTDIEN